MAYTTQTFHSRTYPWTSIMAAPYSCDPTGVSNCAAALETLKTNQANVGTIHAPKGTFRIATDLTIPVGMTLVMEAGTTISIEKDGAVATDLVINGRLDCTHGGTITVADGCSLTVAFLIGTPTAITTTGTGTVTISGDTVFTSSSFANLAAAIAAIGSSVVTLEIDKSETISSDTTIPATTSLVIKSGHLLTIADTKTLAINGPLDAGVYQIFSCTNTGKVTLNEAVVPEAFPEWWGDNTSPGTTDMTAEVQAAVIAHPVVVFQSAIYRLTSPIIVGKNRLIGVEADPMTDGSSSPTLNPGTWLHFDHTGVGLSLTTEHGGFIERLGTFRTQPTPSSTYPTAYAPTAHDYDISTSDVYDITIKDVVLLNPTKGIYAGGAAGGGRINIINLRGQPLQKGIVIEKCWDVVRIEQVHFWPFWGLSNWGAITTNENKNLTNYTRANLDSIHTTKNDGPRITNFFTIHAKSGIRFSENASTQVTQLCQITNFYVDFSLYGIWVDSSCITANSSNGQFTNFVYSGSDVTGGKGIFCEGKCQFWMNTVYMQNSGVQMIHATSASVVLHIFGLTIYNYDQDATNVACIDIANSSQIYVTGSFTIGSSGGTGGRYSTAHGTYYIDDWRDWTPAPTCATGTNHTWGTCTGKYKMLPNTMILQMKLICTTKSGDGAGAVCVDLPIVTSSGWWTGSAKNGVTGKVCSCFTTNGGVAYILLYDNNHAINASGDWLQGQLQYVFV